MSPLQRSPPGLRPRLTRVQAHKHAPSERTGSFPGVCHGEALRDNVQHEIKTNSSHRKRVACLLAGSITSNSRSTSLPQKGHHRQSRCQRRNRSGVVLRFGCVVVGSRAIHAGSLLSKLKGVPFGKCQPADSLTNSRASAELSSRGDNGSSDCRLLVAELNQRLARD